jgi:hypothetical protein
MLDNKHRLCYNLSMVTSGKPAMVVSRTVLCLIVNVFHPRAVSGTVGPGPEVTEVIRRKPRDFSPRGVSRGKGRLAQCLISKFVKN